jgi:ABC-type multidrug transport system fused ATPase/permease subunit
MPPYDGTAKQTIKAQIRSAGPLIWELVRPRWKRLACGLAFVVVSRAAAVVLPISTKYLVDDVFVRRNGHLLGLLILTILAATLIQSGASAVLTQLVAKEGLRAVAELRCKVQRHVSRLPITYFDNNNAGALASRIMSDVEGPRNLLGMGLADFFGAIFMALLSLIFLLKISPQLTVIAIASFLLFSLVSRSGFKHIRAAFRETATVQAEVSGRLTESLAGIRVVKGYHAEAHESKAFASGIHRLLATTIHSLNLMSGFGAVTALITGLASVTVMYLAARQIFASTLTIGDFVAFMVFMSLLTAPMFQLSGSATQLMEALAGLDRTQQLLCQMPEDENVGRKQPIPALNYGVVFEHVSFAYEKGERVLDDVSFEARIGTATAFVGPSGAGKSTIIGLITAFYEPSKGRILVDGFDLSTLRLESYRSLLGVVLQDTFLFDGTIRDNVAFARPDASEADILRSCRIANVDEFAECFPNKYDTVVGERGVKLSGGQRQRISIARAILVDPKILVLDEATSNLDSESEAAIQKALSYLMESRTTFVIAHRLSTVLRADQILVVQDGRIVERGTHQSLYSAHGRYHDFYSRQHHGDSAASSVQAT